MVPTIKLIRATQDFYGREFKVARDKERERE
jgi:hypothetical protein